MPNDLITIPTASERLSGKRLNISRRHFVVGAFASALLLACGSDDDDNGGSSGGNGFPILVEHKYGTTSIPSTPERVVSVGYQDHEFLLGLGIQPVGVREWWGGKPYATWPWAESALTTQPHVFDDPELNIEEVSSLNPDLIVGFYSGITEEQYKLLSQIAPTVTQPGKYVDYGMPWREQAIATGRSVNKEEQAKKEVARVDGLFKAARDNNPKFKDKTVAMAGATGTGNYWIYGKEDPRSRFLQDLGFVVPDDLAALAGDAFYAEFSAEKANLLDVDVLLWVMDATGEAALANDSVYQQLNVVKEKRNILFTWDALDTAALSFSSTLSLPFALEQILPKLATAVSRVS